jgi:hypothetical protein
MEEGEGGNHKAICSDIDSFTHLLVVEFTDVLLFDRLEIIESPQFTTVPFEIENVRKR